MKNNFRLVKCFFLFVSLSMIMLLTVGFSSRCNDAIPDISEGSKAFNALNSILIENESYGDFIELYGGSYIEEDTLFVYYRNDLNEDVLNRLSSEDLLRDYSVVFYPAQYSYNQLSEMMDYIWNLKCLHENDAGYWTSVLRAIGINQSDNCLDLVIDNCCDALLADFESHVDDYPANILFSDNYRIEEQTTMINPGSEVKKGTVPFSVGFRCKKNGEKGFLTTIHSNSTGSTIEYNGNNIGTVTASVNDGYADFSFVKLNSSYEVSLKPKGLSSYQLHSGHFAVSLPTNYTVYLAASTHSGIVSGVVKYNSYTIEYGSDWLVCSYNANSGDSGGCVFTQVNGDYVVVSIHDGVIYDVGTESMVSYSTRLTTIRNQYYNDIVIY